MNDRFSSRDEMNAGQFGGGLAGDAPEEQEAPLIATPSLPTGGGAIRGLGDEWSVNLLTGTGAMTIPVPASPGRGGFGPQLALSYDSVSGNGPFGLGWSLGVPSISRRTDRGIPQYLDAQGSDTFVSSGAGDLVPVLDDDGNPVGRDVVDAETPSNVLYKIEYFRPRIEQDFTRTERWKSTSTGKYHWQTVDRNNVRRVFGFDDSARVFDPKYPHRVFRWLLQRVFDDRGNLTVYEYTKEDGTGVPTGIWETNRSHTSQTYLTKILYGEILPEGSTPFTADGTTDPSTYGTVDPADFHFEVAFDYGQYTDQLHPDAPENISYRSTAPAASSAPGWDPTDDSGTWGDERSDPFSTYRAGFEIRTLRRCRRILMFHRFTELHATDPVIVRELRLGYHDDAEGSKLKQAVVRGYGEPSGGVQTFREHPPLTLGYTPFTVDTSVKTFDADSLRGIGGGIDGSRTRFADIEGEGIAGLLTETAGAWYYKRNEGGGKLGHPVALSRKPNGPPLSSGGMALMDVAGDGGVYAVQLKTIGSGYFERDTQSGKWAPFRPFRSSPNLPWGDANIRFVDIDGDGRMDVLVSEGDKFRWYQSKGKDGFGAPRATFRVRDEMDGPTVVFSDPSGSVFLADMSGDGLTDIVRVRNGSICYWPNLGYGKFGGKVQMGNSPRFDSQSGFNPARIRFGDVDGSGTADVLYFDAKGARLWRNQSGNRWAAWNSDPDETEPEYLRLPATTQIDNVQLADLLGTGTSCLVWSSPLPGRASAPIRYFDLTSSVKPHLLETVNNGRGMERRVTYATSTKFYLEDRKAGRPWATKLPFPVQVVDKVETLDLIAGGRLTTEYSYHHGYYDRVEREFRGFGLVESKDTEHFLPSSEIDGTPDWNLDDSLMDKHPVCQRW